jgi:CheY-like chemotaxis protein
MEPTAVTKSVLIVDDDMTLREMYEDYLKASGFTVISAQDGEEGLAKAGESRPSAILLDLMMPKMNGIEVLRHLKADAELRAIPVIVFTALIQDLEEQESYAAGASDYVVKTEVTPKAIVEKLNHFILVAQHPEAATQPPASAPHPSMPPAAATAAPTIATTPTPATLPTPPTMQPSTPATPAPADTSDDTPPALPPV